MTRTTTYLVSLLLAFAVSPVDAQVSLSRIGILGAPEEPRFTEIVAGLTRGLRELGYTDKTIEIVEGRVPRGDNASERAVVEKMVQQRIQVLFAIGSRLVSQARQVSADLPIIFITPGDPVASGLVASLARPGGNTTGMTFEYPELSGKRLELLKEMAPRVRRVLAMYDPRDDSPKQSIAVAREVAPKLGLTLIERESRSREDDMQALEGVSRHRCSLSRYPAASPPPTTKKSSKRPMPSGCRRSSTPAPAARRKPWQATAPTTPRSPASSAAGRQDPQRNQSQRDPGRTANEIGICHQSENRQADRPDGTAECVGAGGQGDSIGVSNEAGPGDQDS